MKSCKAVIFDLDDVLYPHWEYALGGYRAVANYMLTVYGTPIYEDLAQRYQPDSAEALLADVLAGHFENVEASFLNRLTAVYWSHKPTIKLFPDANVCLAMMKTLNLKTGIVTDGRSDVERAKIAALGLPMLVDSVLYVADMLGDEKLLDSLQMTELLMDVPLYESLYVGNGTTSEFRTANRAGLQTVMIKRPARHAGKAEEKDDNNKLRNTNGRDAAANITIASLDELHSVISVESGHLKDNL